MDVETKIKLQIGELVVQAALLSTQLEQAQKQIAELQEQIKTLTPAEGTATHAS